MRLLVVLLLALFREAKLALIARDCPTTGGCGYCVWAECGFYSDSTTYIMMNPYDGIGRKFNPCPALSSKWGPSYVGSSEYGGVYVIGCSCNTGTSSTGIGCAVCTAGTYGSTCTQCPEGTYSTVHGSTLASCVACDAGYASIPGSTSCVADFSFAYALISDRQTGVIRKLDLVTNVMTEFITVNERMGGIAISIDETYAIFGLRFSGHIKKVDFATGTVSVLAGNSIQTSANGVGTDASLTSTGDLAMSSDGDYVLVTDIYGHCIRKIVIATGVVTTISGQLNTEGYQDGPSESAFLAYPVSIAMASDNTFCLFLEGNRLRKITLTTPSITSTIDRVSFTWPSGIDISYDLSFAIVGDSVGKLKKIDLATSIVTDLATSGGGTGWSGMFANVALTNLDTTLVLVMAGGAYDPYNNVVYMYDIASGTKTLIGDYYNAARISSVKCSKPGRGFGQTAGNRCEKCALGSSGHGQCKTCAKGSFALTVGISACTQCPVQQTTTQRGLLSSATCAACSDGYFPYTRSSVAGNLPDDQVCRTCDSTSVCRVAAAPVACAVCVPGTMTTLLCLSTRLGTCGACTASHYCIGGNSNAAAQVSPCTPACVTGNYETTPCNSTTNRFCTQCPPDSYCLGGTHMSACRGVCTTGTYQSVDCTSTTNRVCPTCPANSYCLDGISAVGCSAVCSAGNYQTVPCLSTSNRECTLCTPGSFCLGGTQITSCRGACTAGTYQSVDCTSTTNRACTTCPANSYCLDGLSYAGCTAACTTGNYETVACTSTSNRECATCTAGSYCPAGVRSTCFANSNSPSGSGAVSSCTCNSGYYGSGSCLGCTVCTAGVTYASVPCGPTLNRVCSSCKSCILGTTYTYAGCNVNADTDCRACSSCVAGSTYRSISCSLAADTTCLSCLVCSTGSFSSTPCTALANTICSPCAAACTAGNYEKTPCNSITDRTCASCTNVPPNAVYAGTGTTSTNCPWKCSNAYFQNGTVCDPCPAGSWCAENVQYTCPTNTQSMPLSSSQNNCTCKPGYFGNGSRTGSSPCPICMASYYCAGGNANISTKCPINFTSSEGAAIVSNCYCKPGYQLVNSLCQLCPAGGYCQSGNLSTCPPNSYSTVGSADISSCVCDPGFSGINGECFQCPADSFCTGGMSVIKCVANAVSPVQSTNTTACYCDRGYQGIDNSPCMACPEGTWCWTGVLNYCPMYTSSPSRSSWWKNCTCIPGYTGPDGSQCEGCLLGTYKSENGSVSCTTCPNHTFCPALSETPAQCTAVCAAGFYETTACSSTTNRVCTACTAGSVCVGGTSIVVCSPGM